MPLTRYQIRNEYGLADPEVYKAADRDDPEAILEGVAMAGLVGVLRQLGDLAEFAAEIFHNLHEEVMATAARGHGLMARVQQLELEVPSIEKIFLSRTNHMPFFANSGVDWHPNLNTEQNLITSGDLPRFVMDSYEECRGPPRLFLLDKFDVAGAGACLTRYTDPSFFKVETASVEFQRERRSRKVKKKGPRERHGGTPQIPTSHAKLHQLLLEERVANGISDPARLVKLKRRQLNGSPFDLKPAKSYMEKFLETSSPEPKLVHEVPFTPSSPKFIEDNYKESEPYIVDINTVSPVKEPFLGKKITSSSPNAHAVVLVQPTDEITDENIDKAIVRTTDVTVGHETHESPSVIDDAAIEEALDLHQDDKTDGSLNVDDRVSEVDNYMDALTVMESEMETDSEYKLKNYRGSLDVRKFLDNDGNGDELDIHANLSDSLSTGNYSQSEDGTNISKKGRSVSSYSNSFGDLNENFTPDEEGKPQLFRSGDDSVVLHADFHSDNEMVSTLGSIPHEDALLSDYSKNFKPPDPGEASCSSSITDSRDIPQPLLSVPVGSLERLPPEDVKLQSQLPNKDNETSLPESSVVTVDIPPQIFTSRISSESHHICEPDHEEEKPTSAALVWTSKDMLEPSHERRDSDDSVDDVLQTKYEVEVSSDNVGKEGTLSSCSVISTREQQNSCSTLPETAVGSVITRSLDNMNILNYDSLVSVVDDCRSMKDGSPSSSNVPKPDDTVTEVDHTLETEGTIEQEHNRPVPQVEVDLAVVPSSEEKTELEEVSDAGVVEENNKITGNSDMAGEADTASPHSSRYLDKDNLDHQLQEDGSLTKDIDETVVISSAAAAGDIKESGPVDALSADDVSGDVENLDSSSVRNLLKLEEPSSVSEGAYLSKFDCKVSLESSAESQAQRELKQPEAPSTEHDPAFNISFSNDWSKTNLEVKAQVDSLSTGKEVYNNPGPNEVTEGYNSKPRYEEMKPKSGSEIPWFSRTCYTPAEASSSDQSVQLQSDNIDSSSFCGGEVNVESLNFSATSTCMGNPVESSHEGQSDTLGGECVQSFEAKKSSNFSVGESEQLYTPSKAGEERCDDMPFESEELLPQPDSLQNNGDKLLRNPFVSYPGFAILPEAIKTSSENVPPLSTSTEPEGAPPMPPLPPIQWRRGKEVQHPTLPEQKEWIIDGWNTFPHLQSSASERTGTFGFASLGTEIAPPNPFLFPNALDSQRLGTLSAEAMEMSDSLFLEKPAGVNDTNRLNNVHVETTESTNPFLTSETTPGDGVRQDLFTSIKEPTQSDVNVLPVPSTLEHKTCDDELKDSMSLPSSHFDEKAPEKALEIKTEKKAAEDSSQNLEEEQRSLPSSHLDEKAPEKALEIKTEKKAAEDSLQNLEEEQRSLPSSYLDEKAPEKALEIKTEKKAAEDSSQNLEEEQRSLPSSHLDGKAPEKALEIKTEKKAAEDSSQNLEEEQRTSPDKPSAQVAVSEEQFEHDLSTSNGGIVGPPSTLGLPLTYEVGKINGNKIPRPRNPLFDAVSLDKSKLRKASERVRPQVEPKADERDSILEQIRTKSFSLKPTSVTRPRPIIQSIQGPNTNLKVAAILEKANTIRQAMAGSDEDADSDSWSDS